MILFKEQAFVEASVRAIYPIVDSICCVTQFDRNLAGETVEPDHSLQALLNVPDPENKIRVIMQRDLSDVAGGESEAKQRNAAMALDPKADYYLIVDSDEIWPAETLRKCWAYVQKTKWAAYKASVVNYFQKWNYQIIEPEERALRPLVFLRRGFQFSRLRAVQWHCPARWREYLRHGRKPKTAMLPSEWRLHHGTCVGDDYRILNKLLNYSHNDLVDATWFERVWKNFHPGMQNFHYFRGAPSLFERVISKRTDEMLGKSPIVPGRKAGLKDKDASFGWPGAPASLLCPPCLLAAGYSVAARLDGVPRPNQGRI